ncbi:MAG: cytochrome c3 family protein [Bacteroidia bacterium]|nr:cytochrome c3 family protein [Bacteroidia bacterium]
MKKLIISTALGLILPFMNLAQSYFGPGAITTTIAGSVHDFSVVQWNPYNATTTMGGQICQPCHTPHNADPTITAAPLWNHSFTTQSYQMYTGYEFGPGGSGYNVIAPDGTSKLCLSCHDGSVAMGSFGGQIGFARMTSDARVGLDLRDDHPISFVYDSLQAGGVWDKTHVFSGTKRVSDLLDANSKVQCTSCHLVHSNPNGYLLNMSNQGSALCLACHKK